MQRFECYPVEPGLRPWVDNFWHLLSDGTEPYSQRVVPSGSASLCFLRGAPGGMVTEAGIRAPETFCGFTTGFREVAVTGPLDMLVAELNPFAAGLLFPGEYLRDTRELNLRDIEDPGWRGLAERIRSEENVAVSVRLLEEFLREKIERRSDDLDRRLRFAGRCLGDDPQSDICRMADKACLSIRQFDRVFSERTGTTPKDFQRVVRFQRSLHLMQTRPDWLLASVAVEAGYYDESHLIGEFKRMSGHTPGRYRKIYEPFSDLYSF